ncbi:CCCH-type zinc finger protein with ARM repeat domain-containing protein [Actinidia rufa]|uniref:CCCH-type zinc finger protein with ARM repeat domain-containing protein n=1 Tax=Actinidia rufa TaxID=165716 RepID=A0A7J0GQC1_9ERIC|nr:CCCH-type zinc finger protein with ARM repeat domain-containing protein [Actinidia rufa]
MCSGPDQLNSETLVPLSLPDSVKLTRDMNNLAEISFSSLLELAADNNVEGFKHLIFRIASAINDMGLWYGRQRASSQMVLKHRTPLMVAATYGSVDIVKLILSLSEADVNLSCGPDKSTALHCAASSGSVNAVNVVKLLLLAGADRDSMNASGHHPIDVVVAPPKFPDLKDALEVILRDDDSIHLENLKISYGSEKSVSPPLSSSPQNGPMSSAVDSTSALNHFRLGSAVPSPRSLTSAASVMDMAVALSLLPGSPSAVGGMSPSPFTPPMLPSGNAIMYPSVAWPQQNIPTLHLPGSNFQTSCLRSSFNARDIPTEELDMLLDFEVQQQQLLNDISCFSQTHPNTSSPKLPVRPKTLTPSNLDDVFSREVSSPRFTDQDVASAMFSPSHKTVAPYNVPSPGRMSPQGIEPQSLFSPRLSSLAHCENQQTQLRSLSSRDLGTNGAGIVGSPVNFLAKWEYPNGAVDWSVDGDELSRVRKSFTSGHNGEEPDLSWVQSLVKESPPEIKETPLNEDSDSNSTEKLDHAVFGAWLEQMQLDKVVA